EPTGSALLLLAAAANVDPAWLLTGEGEAHPTADPSREGKAAVEEAWAHVVLACEHVARAVDVLAAISGTRTDDPEGISRALKALADARVALRDRLGDPYAQSPTPEE